MSYYSPVPQFNSLFIDAICHCRIAGFVQMRVIDLRISFLITRLMERTTVKPINAIAKAAQSYVEDRRSGNTRMEHFSSLPIRTGDEVEHLNL